MSKNAKRVVVGALVAGAAGYVAGILTAPKPGKETRKDIKKTAQKTSAEIEKTLKQLHEQLETLLKQAEKQAVSLKKTGAVRLRQSSKAAVAAKEKLRKALSSIHEGDGQAKELEKAMREAHKAILHLEHYLAGNEPAKK